jgi:hypothetical protein
VGWVSFVGIYYHNFLITNLDEWVAVLLEAGSNATVGTIMYYAVIPGLNTAFLGEEAMRPEPNSIGYLRIFAVGVGASILMKQFKGVTKKESEEETNGEITDILNVST